MVATCRQLVIALIALAVGYAYHALYLRNRPGRWQMTASASRDEEPVPEIATGPSPFLEQA